MRTADPLVRALGLLELDAWRVTRSILAGIATLGSALALAALSAWLITRAWQMPPVLDLTVAVVAVRALGISRGLFRYLERLSTHDTALRGTTAARAGLYRRLAEGEPSAAAGLRRGDLLARTGADVDTIGDVIVKALVPIAVAVVLALAAVGVLAVISPAAAAVLALALVASGVAAPMMSARAARTAEERTVGSRARYADAAVTALDHAAELRVTGHLDAALGRASAAERAACDARDRSAVPNAFAAAATPLAIGASVLASLVIGTALYGSTDMSPMALGILVLLPLSAFEATAPLPDAAKALGHARSAARRVVNLLDAAGDAEPTGGAAWDGTGVVRADAVRCGWPGGRVTPPIDLDLGPGARIAVVGPSGVGKTTLLMTLAGLLPPVSGTVTVDGVDEASIAPGDLRRHLQFFAEDAHVFDTSVLENLRVVRGDVGEAEARDALHRVGLAEWLDDLPDDLDTRLGGGMRAVSGGQRRRLLLARALLSPAPILLLDEPTEHLDAAAGAELLRALLSRGGGLVDEARTVVVVTHQLPTGTDADVVLTLDGKATENTLPAP
ncbi:thiol reductant ABC exporter subunit CydC [Rhodococcus sp. HNM0569]|uniref:thiol reductant ABC exporter subunit CydC n=1 Tax=Rhodococcus sp. HNM0569 TaxID=2716340 RepID=UPI00146D6331|nr:thiol reductant ABC exporter subunit CydC [Rhodococcus sp. HNM0569]NLU82356.1 thiol reductant ABC exporter subunit CydC [Rhodococcus sp. HNM0569]